MTGPVNEKETTGIEERDKLGGNAWATFIDPVILPPGSPQGATNGLQAKMLLNVLPKYE
jgi:hypothetical protein